MIINNLVIAGFAIGSITSLTGFYVYSDQKYLVCGIFAALAALTAGGHKRQRRKLASQSQ